MTLVERINRLKFHYLLVAGDDATLLLLPKRRQFVKDFAEAVVNEVGAEETGSVPRVFHNLMTGENQMSICELEVRLYNGDDLAVGRELQ